MESRRVVLVFYGINAVIWEGESRRKERRNEEKGSKGRLGGEA